VKRVFNVSSILMKRHTANDVSIVSMLWTNEAPWFVVVRYSSTISWSPVSNFLSWYRFAPAWHSNGLIHPIYIRVVGAHVRPAQRRRQSDVTGTRQCFLQCAQSCCRVHLWRPLSAYARIKTKLASCYLLLYVVYIMYRKSLNFMDAFCCYMQKWKLAPFNLTHPVFKNIF